MMDWGEYDVQSDCDEEIDPRSGEVISIDALTVLLTLMFLVATAFALAARQGAK